MAAEDVEKQGSSSTGPAQESKNRSWIPAGPPKAHKGPANHEVITKNPRKIDDMVGYPKAAAFQSSLPNFSLYRGFSYLHSRVLLDLQDEIASLEEEIDAIDSADMQTGNEMVLQSRTRDVYLNKKDLESRTRITHLNKEQVQEGHPRSRRQVLSEIREKLAEYDDLLIKARDLAGFRKPSKREYLNVRHWFYNQKPLVLAEESRSIQCKEDIVTIYQGREWTAFDGLILSTLERISFINYFLSTPELRSKTDDPYSKLYSPYRIEAFVGIILLPILCLLLVLPIFIMYRLNVSHSKFAFRDAVIVLIAFTVLFAGVMPFITKAGRNEVFAASAAYSAVLVVFISNFSVTDK